MANLSMTHLYDELIYDIRAPKKVTDTVKCSFLEQEKRVICHRKTVKSVNL
jgi:hypothetical protein